MTRDRPESGPESGGTPRPPGTGFTVFLLAASALAAASVLLRQVEYGVFLGLDSLYYLEVARNLAAGEGFTHFDGTAYTLLWAPLYPLLLAVLGLGRFDPTALAGPLGAAAFGLSVFVLGRLLARRLRFRSLAVWAALSAALAAPLAGQAAWAMTDLLLILFSVLALAETEEFLAGGRTRSLVRAGLFAGLAWTSRLAGAAVPGAVGLLLLFSRDVPRRQRARQCLLFAALAGAPMGLWTLRHFLAFRWTGRETGAAYESLPFFLRELGGVLLDWARPVVLRDSFAGSASAVWPVLLLAPAGAALAAVGVGYLREGWRRRAPSDWRPVTVFGVFALCYLALLLGSLSTIDLRGLPPRYLLPLFLPLLVLAATTLDRVLAHERGRRAVPPGAGPGSTASGIRRALFSRGPARARAVALLSGAALCLWTAGQVAANVEEIRAANAGEAYLGYSGPDWARSRTLEYLRRNPLSGPVYSNEPVVLAFHGAGGDYENRGYLWSCQTNWRRRQAPSVEERLGSWLAGVPDGAFVVSFHGRWSAPCAYGAAALRTVPGLRPVADLEDGAVYRVDRAGPPRPNPYRSAAAAAASGEAGPPLLRSRFDIYHREGALLYLREPCAAGEEIPDFTLRVFPPAAADSPDANGGPGFEDRDFEDRDFEDRDFAFREHGLVVDGKCVALVPLPPEAISRFRTGQWTPDAATTWSAAARLDFDRFRAAGDRIASGALGEPVVRSAFDLYLDGKTLAYRRAPCAAADTGPRFLLHLTPSDEADLPPDAASGFENRDFDFGEHGMRLDGECLALVPLPAHDLAAIATGQWRPGEPPFWREVVRLDLARSEAAFAALAVGAAGEPAARSAFDLYLDDGDRARALTYHRAECAEEDLEARFFLHLFPADRADLPAERRRLGFENRDFEFAERGVRREGACLARIGLPDYPLARLRTGQWVSGEGELWGAEIPLPQSPEAPRR